MMQIVKRVLPVLFAALMLADSARAHTIDFDDLALGGFPGDTLVVDVDGVNVTFSGDGLATWSLDQVVFPGSGVQLVAGGFYGPITVEIEPGYSFDSISIINHLSSDFPRGTEPNITLPPHSEVDVITGRAFDQDGLLVDSFTSDMRLASLTGTGIVILTFEAPETAFLLDDLSFVIVPEPNAALLIALGLAILARKPRIEFAISSSRGSGPGMSPRPSKQQRPARG